MMWCMEPARGQETVQAVQSYVRAIVEYALAVTVLIKCLVGGLLLKQFGILWKLEGWPSAICRYETIDGYVRHTSRSIYRPVWTSNGSPFHRTFTPNHQSSSCQVFQ